MQRPAWIERLMGGRTRMGRVNRDRRGTAPKRTLTQHLNELRVQFRALDRDDPSAWPAAPRYLVCLLILLSLFSVLWFVWLSDVLAEHDHAQAQEAALRQEFSRKLVQVANLDALRKQREQVTAHVNQLERQLPSQAEMDALLSDINQAGVARRLQFELFRPGQTAVRDYYAELPISVRVTGRFGDVGLFAADIAGLSRIVTLGEMSMQPTRDGAVVLDATVRTFRYLDAAEVQAQRKAAGGKK